MKILFASISIIFLQLYNWTIEVEYCCNNRKDTIEIKRQPVLAFFIENRGVAVPEFIAENPRNNFIQTVERRVNVCSYKILKQEKTN